MSKLILVIALGLFFGCATANKINQISLGMTKTEIIKIMGPPTSTSAIEGTEYLNYGLYETDEAAQFGRSTPYFVRIIDGKVNAYGRRGDFDSTQ